MTAIATQRLRVDTRGKRCGAGYIAQTLTCHKGQLGAITPRALAKTPSRGSGDWRTRAAQVAGATALTAAVALPVASFVRSGSHAGRRQTNAWARVRRQSG